jgi:hypothetical protein
VNVKRAILSCLSVLLVACGAPSEPPKSNVIGDPLQQSLDKAQSVEGLTKQRKDDLDKAVDAAN